MLKIREVSDLDIAFPTDDLKWLPEGGIPVEFRNRHTKWNAIFSQWFYRGLPGTTEFKPKPGVDAKKALRCIGATMGSWAPKHQHKEAAVAYMLSEWFEDVIVPEKTK